MLTHFSIHKCSLQKLKLSPTSLPYIISAHVDCIHLNGDSYKLKTTPNDRSLRNFSLQFYFTAKRLKEVAADIL